MFIPFLPKENDISTAPEITAPETQGKGVPATRLKLLAAAEKLFSTPGYHRVQVADITAAAGTGVGTFYRYFGEKEQILQELLQGFLADIRTRVAAIRDGIETMQPKEQIEVVRDTFTLIMGELQARPTLTRIMFRTGYGISETINNLIWRFITLMTEDIITDLERAQMAQVIAVPYKHALATAITGMTLHTAHALVVEDNLKLEQVVETCMRFTVGGLSAFSTEDYFAATTDIFRQLLGSNALSKS